MAKPVRAAPESLPGSGPVETSVGQRLRARREARGVSLREFARRLGLSPSAISKIETDKYRPSVSTLWSIVSELGMSLDELFAPGPDRAPAPSASPAAVRPAEGEAPGGEHVQRAGSRKVVELDSGVTWERLTATEDPEADFLSVRYDVGGCSSRNDGFIRHSGREYGLVLRGMLEVTVGSETYVLGPGDSISFESTTPHRLRNVSDEPIEGVWVVIGRRRAERAG